jgi:hypothetical protein
MNPIETPHAHLGNAFYYSSWNDHNPYEQPFTYASTPFNTLPALNVHSNSLPTFAPNMPPFQTPKSPSLDHKRKRATYENTIPANSSTPHQRLQFLDAEITRLEEAAKELRLERDEMVSLLPKKWKYAPRMTMEQKLQVVFAAISSTNWTNRRILIPCLQN